MKIFISYARENTEEALAIQQALSIHDVWRDHKLSVGQEWWAEIERQIAAAHCFLYVVSSHALNSEYCQKELAFAMKLEKPIAPVMVEEILLDNTLSRYQVISATSGIDREATIRLLNGLFEIERQVFNPLKPKKQTDTPLQKLSIRDLYFATTNAYKKQRYEQILNVQLQTAALDIEDKQHVDVGEVALYKAQQAYKVLQKPVFIDHAGFSVRAWGGLPGGITNTFVTSAGLNTVCKMLSPFSDRYAEAIAVIAFTDGDMRRKFVGVLEGEIAEKPRGNGYSWNNIFIPTGFNRTLGEMSDEESDSISYRRWAIIAFMKFLQDHYEIT